MKLLKNILILLGPLGLQVYTYFRFEPKVLEDFFFIWGVIYLILLVYTFITTESNTPLVGTGGYKAIGVANAVKRYADVKNNEYFKSLSITKISFGLYLVLNIIGYLVVII